MQRLMFSREYKLEAVKLVRERGVTVDKRPVTFVSTRLCCANGFGNTATTDALLHHSDQGSQYSSEQFQRIMGDHGITCSMSRSRNVWDNAAMGSFFSSLKTERTARKVYRTRNDARADAFDYVEHFYNPKRRHSTLGYLSPNDLALCPINRQQDIPRADPVQSGS